MHHPILRWRFAVAGIFLILIMCISLKMFSGRWRFCKNNASSRFYCRVAALIILMLWAKVQAQSIRFPWSSYSHDPQHDCIAAIASQPLNRIVWQTPVDLSVPASNTGELWRIIHSLRVASDHTFQYGDCTGENRGVG
jgi:hypothetical protein